MSDVNTEQLQKFANETYGRDLQAALRLATSNPRGETHGMIEALGTPPYNASHALAVTALGGRAANFPGTNGAYWETPDHASLDIIGDIDIRAEIPNFGVTGLNRDIISKYTPAAQQSFEWRYNAFGLDEFVWSTTGANALTDTAAISSGHYVRFTMDVVSGTDRVLTWWNGQGFDGPWAVRLQETVAGTTSIFASTAVLRIGVRGDPTGTNPFSGQIARVQLRAGIDGTIVANPDFRFVAPGATSFADSTGKTWTLTGAGGTS